MNCNYCKDEFCVNGDCPYRADFCPVVDFQNACKYYEEEDKMNDNKTGITDNDIKFYQHSFIDAFADKNLGTKFSAVEAYVDLMSTMISFLDKVHPDFLHRWLDCYYQLRLEAEREAELAKIQKDRVAIPIFEKGTFAADMMEIAKEYWKSKTGQEAEA